MKRLNYLLAGLLSLSLLVACNKDEDHNGGSENGKEIYAAFSIKVGSPGTYADPLDETGDGVEATVKNVTIYIFKGTTLEATGVTSVTGATGTTNVATSLGQKTIFALVNSTGNLVAPPEAVAGVTSLSAFKASLKQTLDYANIAKSGDFLMFGELAVKLDESNTGNSEATVANPITISVNRISTKVSMLYPTEVPKGTLKGTFSDKFFALNQTEVDIDITRELNYEPTTTVYSDSPKDGTFDHLSNTPTAYKPAQTLDAEVRKFANSLYCLENINTFATAVDVQTGKLTFVIVKVKYTPHTDEFEIGGTKIGDTYYSVKQPDGTSKIYNDATVAATDDAITVNNKIQVHTDGFGYYRLNLGDISKTGTDKLTEKYAVLRNHMYKVSIQSNTGLGVGDPADLIPKEPTTPVETSAHMTANITVLPWTVVHLPGDLN